MNGARLPPTSPSRVKTALENNYNAIMQRFIHQIQHQRNFNTPPHVIRIRVNEVIRDFFMINLMNQRVLHKGELTDPRRIRYEMGVIQAIYRKHFNAKYGDDIINTRLHIIPFDEIYQIYKDAWTEKKLMPPTPEKRT